MTKYNRQSMRLAGYDYSKPGYSFVTICTHGRQLLFGDINDDKMETNSAGQLIDREWKQLPARYPWIHLYEHIIMPNHSPWR
jgi:putative transposase